MRDKWIKKIVETLLGSIEPTGGQEKWEKGWGENLKEGNSIPKYFGKYPVVRKNGKFIKAPKGFEYEQLIKLEKKVFKKYLKNAECIVELGCGTGHNLTRVREINPKAWIAGFDWADSAVTNVQNLGFAGKKIDLFNPTFNDFKNVSVFTVAAFEQLGDRFHKIVDLLVEERPEIVVHLEPIEELMNPDNLLDYLQLEYMKKRKYLTGFLTYLRELEKNGKIEIVKASRNGVGSLFIEGYSLIVWKPK